jgi:thioredoxin-related protein
MPIARRYRRALIAAILALPVLPAAAAERLAYAEDLAATAVEAGRRGVPVMIVFTEASCPYCAQAKRDYLVPLQSRGPFAGKVIVREVDVASAARLRDFAGRITTHRDYARSASVRRVPTVLVVDGRGEPLAAPVIGLLAPDFYRLYLERAIEEGLLKLRAAASERS